MEEKSVIDLLGKVLHVESPWYVEDIELNSKVGTVEVRINYQKGSKFECSECEKSCKVHDSVVKTIRHLDLFEYKCYLKIKVPRTHCDVHGVKTFEKLPFCRPGSHFSFFLSEK